MKCVAIVVNIAEVGAALLVRECEGKSVGIFYRITLKSVIWCLTNNHLVILRIRLEVIRYETFCV